MKQGEKKERERRERRGRREESQREVVRGVRERVKGRRKRGHKVRYKGRGKPKGMRRVPGEWVYGRLTNERQYREYAVKKNNGERNEKQMGWYEEHRKGREKWLRGKPGKPGVRVRGERNENALGEARRCGVPTVGSHGKETYVREGERMSRLVRRREVDV
jgi:hypothetical protein